MTTDTNVIENILLGDPVWSAYALADLAPEHRDYCSWLVGDQSIILIYSGLRPPVLFTQGSRSSISTLISRVPVGTYQFSCRPEHLDVLGASISATQTIKMWRMVFSGGIERLQIPGRQPVRLDERNLNDIQQLFANQPDAPDAFKSSQLQSGAFFGVYDREHLVAISGTHVLSSNYQLAAIGNVFTDPDYRGNGFALLATRAVVDMLVAGGIETIVLNVAKENMAAIKTYQRIGFLPYCEYIEGHGKRV